MEKQHEFIQFMPCQHMEHVISICIIYFKEQARTSLALVVDDGNYFFQNLFP